MNVQKKTALIVGASGGVGWATALALGEQGYSLALIARREERLRALAREIESKSSGELSILPIGLDITSHGAEDVIKQKLASWSPEINVLVFSAGALAVAPLGATSEDELERQLAANATSVYRIVRALLPAIPKGGGDVVICNSSFLRFPREGLIAYGMSQGALWMFAETLRKEINAAGIRVLSVFLGRTASERMEALYAREGRGYRPETLLQPRDVASTIAHALSLPRTAEITDIHLRPAIKH